MTPPTIRSHSLYRRIRRRLKQLSRSEISPAVEQSLIDLDCAVWFLQLSIEGDNYVREKLFESANDLSGVPTELCGMACDVIGTNDSPIAFDDDSCLGGS